MDLKIHSLIKNLQKNIIYYNKIVFKFASFYNVDLKFKKHSFEGKKKNQKMLSPSGNRLTSGLHEHPPKDATMVSGAELTVENLIYNVMNDQEMKM